MLTHYLTSSFTVCLLFLSFQGITWQNIISFGGTSLTMTTDGSTVFTSVYPFGIYKYVRGGTRFVKTSAPDTKWTNVACSADCRVILAVTQAAGSCGV